VPRCAASKAPRRESAAPVKAPRTWPKSSLSMSVTGMAPQSTTTNGPSARALASWMACARTSLPVPVSPSMSTVPSAGANRSIRAKTRRMASLTPMARPNCSRGLSASRTSSPVGSSRSTERPHPMSG